MAEATLNDVTNNLILLRVEQGNTTGAVKALVKRVQEMLDINKRQALDNAEAAREAKNAARSQAQGTGATTTASSPFGVGDALIAGAALSYLLLQDRVREVLESIKQNFLSFANNLQKIGFTIGVLFDDLTDLIRLRIIEPNAKTITRLKEAAQSFQKVMSKVLSVMGGFFRFTVSILRPIVAVFTAGQSEVLIFMKRFLPVLSFVKGIGKIFSRLFLPLTVFITAWDTVKGFIEGFNEEGIVGGIEGAVIGFFNSLIGAPLDLITKATEWVLRAFGFDETADELAGFKPTEVFENIIKSVFKPIKQAVAWMETLFTDPKQALQDAWQGLLVEGGYKSLIDIIFRPVNLAVGVIQRMFGFHDPDNPFSMGSFIETQIMNAVGIFQDLFSRLMNFLRSIPVVKEFFKGEEEKELKRRRKELEDDIKRQQATIKALNDDTKTLNTFIRSAGDPEVVGISGVFKSEAEKEMMREAARKRLQARQDELATLSSDRRLIEIGKAQTAQILALANRELSAMQGNVQNTVVDNSTVAPNNTTVHNQMSLPVPSVEMDRVTMD